LVAIVLFLEKFRNNFSKWVLWLSYSYPSGARRKRKKKMEWQETVAGEPSGRILPVWRYLYGIFPGWAMAKKNFKKSQKSIGEHQ
jgi:hypothetical protein